MEYAALLDEIRQRQTTLFRQINRDTGPPGGRRMKAMSAIQKYLLQAGAGVDGYSSEDLINRLYNDIFQYSILTDPLSDVWVSRIDIHGWDDVRIRLVNGQSHKLPGFAGRQQAEETVDRLLAESGLKIDLPFVSGALKPVHGDIVVVRPPVTAGGLSCVIEKKTRRTFTTQDYLANGFAAEQELDFLKLALAHGTSILLTGLPGSGKTAFLEYLMDSLPAEISGAVWETGCREVEASLLVKKEMLKPLLFDAHGGGADVLAFNCQTPLAVLADTQVPAVVAQAEAKYPADGIRCLAGSLSEYCGCRYGEALRKTCCAFPLIVSLSALPPGREHRILAVSECQWKDGHAEFNPIWQYTLGNMAPEGGRTAIAGYHRNSGKISEELLNHMGLFGLAPDEMKQIEGDEENAGSGSTRTADRQPEDSGGDKERRGLQGV